MKNLNNLELIDVDGCDPSFPNNNTKSEVGVSVYFKDIEQKLINHIKKAEVIVGCVAWLTSFPILDELAKDKYVSIIVQKEDFLRPDNLPVRSMANWTVKLQEKYFAIPSLLDRYKFNELKHMSYCSDPTLEALRCVGNHNLDKHPAFPRMHNKFIVFGDIKTYGPENFESEFDNEYIAPYGVWTGSFNFTKNATYSLENALYITIPDIVSAYFKEYQFIAGLSEQLDWTSEWCEPEWRIGS